MKTKIILAVSTLAGLLACKKTVNLPANNLASLNFVNTTVGSASLATKFNNKNIIFSNFSANEVGYGSSHIFSPFSGNNIISFIQSSDTLHNLFQGKFQFQKGGIYTLFLTGTVSQPDTVFIPESLPQHSSTDSVAGVRFINLSSGSDPVSVDIQGQVNGSEAASLSYKEYTGFKIYKADHSISSYIFEFRDAASGTLLANYTLKGINNSTGTNTTANAVRFHNQTLVLIGQPAGGTVAQKIILVPNY